MLFLWTRAVTFLTIQNLNQMRHDATSVVEKNKIETGSTSNDIASLSRWSDGHESFPFRGSWCSPGSCQPRSRKVHESVFSSRRGWQDDGIREESRGAKKRETRGAAPESEKRKKRGKKREEEIVHLSSCKVGKMDGTRNLPSPSWRLLGHNLQFLTITLDQPPYKRTYYVTTLRQDSHERLDAR